MVTKLDEEKYKVFISYGCKDGSGFAEHLKLVLDNTGYPSFMAPSNVPGVTPDPGKCIDGAIEDCEYFVVILTDAACKSKNVRHEISRAKKAYKIIIPCKEKGLSSKKIPKGIETGPQRITFENERDLARLVISSLINPERLSSYETGIHRIFLSRRHDPSLEEELKPRIINSREEVLMMGISFRDFFGKKGNSKPSAVYGHIIEEAILGGVKFRVLLIDPTSEAAKRRAIIESGEENRDDKNYIKCQLFKDIKRVATWLNDPQVNDLRCRISRLIEVRFYDSMPSIFAIKTDYYTFIEQYHMGNLKVLGKKYEKKGVLCLGGYVPLFKVDNSRNFGKLIKDHFENIWKSAESNDLQKVLRKMDDLKKDPRSFRMKQFLEFTLKRSSDLIGMEHT